MLRSLFASLNTSSVSYVGLYGILSHLTYLLCDVHNLVVIANSCFAKCNFVTNDSSISSAPTCFTDKLT